MSNALTKSDTQQLAETGGPNHQEILRSDVVVPQVLLMQGLSELIANKAVGLKGERIETGDFVRSTNGEILAASGKALEFIPLMYTSAWIMTELVGKKYEFRGYEPRTARNEDLPWDFEKNGSQWRRTKVMNVFALLPQDVAAEQTAMKKFKETGEVPDLDANLLPVVIQFKSTGFAAGKNIATHFAKAQQGAHMGQRAYHYKLSLTAAEQENDKGQFYVPEVSGRAVKASPEEIGAATRWVSTLGDGGGVKIDSEETVSETTAPQPKSSQKF